MGSLPRAWCPLPCHHFPGCSGCLPRMWPLLSCAPLLDFFRLLLAFLREKLQLGVYYLFEITHPFACAWEDREGRRAQGGPGGSSHLHPTSPLSPSALSTPELFLPFFPTRTQGDFGACTATYGSGDPNMFYPQTFKNKQNKEKFLRRQISVNLT